MGGSRSKLKAPWTHHVLTDPSGADLEVVPRDEQHQKEGQHVEIPVPHRNKENLQEEANVSVGIEEEEDFSSDILNLPVS